MNLYAEMQIINLFIFYDLIIMMHWKLIQCKVLFGDLSQNISAILLYSHVTDINFLLNQYCGSFLYFKATAVNTAFLCLEYFPVIIDLFLLMFKPIFFLSLTMTTLTAIINQAPSNIAQPPKLFNSELSGPNPAVADLFSSYPGKEVSSKTTTSTLSSSSSGPSSSGQTSGTGIQSGKQVTLNEVMRAAAFTRQINANKAVANLVSIVQQLTANINNANSGVTKSIAGRLDLQQKMKACNEKVLQLINNRTKIQIALSSKKNELTNTNKSINQLTTQIEQLTKKTTDINNNRLDIKQSKLLNYGKLLVLENRLADLKKTNTTDLENQVFLDNLQKDIKDLQDLIDQQQAQESGYEQSIQNSTALITEKQAQNKVLTDKAVGIAKETTILEKQLSAFQETITNQSNACNDEVEYLRRNNQDGQSYAARTKADLDKLKEANANLEKARAEKNLADQAVEEIIASTLNVVPFPIAPNTLTELLASIQQKNSPTPPSSQKTT